MLDFYFKGELLHGKFAWYEEREKKSEQYLGRKWAISRLTVKVWSDVNVNLCVVSWHKIEIFLIMEAKYGKGSEMWYSWNFLISANFARNVLFSENFSQHKRTFRKAHFFFFQEILTILNHIAEIWGLLIVDGFIMKKNNRKLSSCKTLVVTSHTLKMRANSHDNMDGVGG